MLHFGIVSGAHGDVYGMLVRLKRFYESLSYHQESQRQVWHSCLDRQIIKTYRPVSTISSIVDRCRSEAPTASPWLVF